MILPDSNILIDVIAADANWCSWSQDQLAAASAAGRVVINAIVLAEVAPYAGPLDEFLDLLDEAGIDLEPLCAQSAYAAGAAFQTYRARRSGDGPKSILSDFLIGGHAQQLGATILTRDPRFYRAYFPDIPLITPSKDDND